MIAVGGCRRVVNALNTATPPLSGSEEALWAFFMVWAVMVSDGIKPIYADSHTLNRGDPTPKN